jgi:hypothetical protein
MVVGVEKGMGIRIALGKDHRMMLNSIRRMT